MSRYLFGFIYKKIFVYLETTYFSSSHFWMFENYAY
jgi:hypothetical protein